MQRRGARHARAIVGVAPGRYRFFLLPRFDWLLSARRVRDSERPTADEEALAMRYCLSAVNGFDPAALPENRVGRLTPEQARWLHANAPDIGWRLVVLFGFAISLGVVLVTTSVGDMRQLGVTNTRLESLIAGLAWAAIWTYLLVKQFVDNAKQKRDARDGHVVVYEGIVTKWEGWKHGNSDNSNTWVYRYEFAGARFEVSRLAFRALADGFVHRAYHTPRSMQLVNIELLPAAVVEAEQTTDAVPYERGSQRSESTPPVVPASGGWPLDA